MFHYRTIISAAALLLLGVGVAVAAPGVAGMPRIQSGIASWYGPGFEGKRQANGCVYHQARLSAASRTLPLGTWIKVRRLHSPYQVTVEVTDRGPYVTGRVLDLSRAAAEALDMVAVGLVAVSIEPLNARLSVGCRRQLRREAARDKLSLFSEPRRGNEPVAQLRIAPVVHDHEPITARAALHHPVGRGRLVSHGRLLQVPS